MRYRVPRNIVCTSFCSCAIGGMYIFSITFSLLFLSLTQTHEQTLFRAHTYKHTHTHYIYLYISLTLSVSISLFIILILFLFFFFFHLFFYRSFTYLPSIRFVAAFRTISFLARFFNRYISTLSFYRFFFLFVSFFATFALPSFSFVITRTTNDERTDYRSNSRQNIHRYITFPQ